MLVELQQVFTGHVGANYSLSKSHLEHIFYSGSADRFVGAWNLKTGSLEGALVRGSASIYSLWLDSEKNLLYIGQRKGTLLIVDLSKKEEPRAIQAHQGDIFSVVINHGHIITAGGDGYMKVWNQEDMVLLYEIFVSPKNIRCLHLSPYDDTLFVGSSDSTIRVYDTQNMSEIQNLSGHTNSVFTIEQLDENRIVSSGRDAIFLVWEKEDDKWIEKQKIQAHLYTVNHMTLSPNKELLASGSRDKTIKIWDAQTLELLKVIDYQKYPESHMHSINRLLWLDDETLISTGDDRKIISWSITRL